MKKQPLKVGVTGGIGSGKSTVCDIFKNFGIPIYNSDARAKALMVDNKAVMEQIIDNIGAGSYFEDGSLNRKYIANVVFQQPEKLKKLNSIVHPAVALDGLEWDKLHSLVPYTIKEAALMIESGSFKNLDYVIVVTAPKELRIKRVMGRDNVAAEAVEARMNKQMPEEEKVKYADFIILNDGTQSLVKQVFKVHQQLLASLLG